MTRTIAARGVAVAAAVLASTLLAGCAGQSEYCAAVEKDADVLNSFGKTRTDKAYETYASTFGSIAKLAPTTVKDDWTALADVTTGVLEAQEAVGVPLEDMQDDDKVGELDENQLASLNEAYEAFNDTSSQRDAVVKNAKTECEITLR